MSQRVDFYSVVPSIERGHAFNFFIGGRGIGKTYSALDYVCANDISHIYLRRTQTEVELSCSKEGNPYKVLNRDRDYGVTVSGGKLTSIIKGDTNIGYACGLSTFGNLRGVDFSDVDLIIFDEFQPGEIATARPIKNEYDAFCNLYETVNRDRELLGHPPVQVLFLSNSTTLTSPILMGMGLVQIIEGMLKSGQQKYTDNYRSLTIQIPRGLEVSNLKRNTVLYRNSGRRFTEHALDNKFAYSDFSDIIKADINSYLPYLAIDYDGINIYLYRHKHTGDLYISSSPCTVTLLKLPKQMEYLRRNYFIGLKDYLISGHIRYESYTYKAYFLEIMETG